MACLFKVLKSNLKGIPLDITNAALNAAKSMIMGSYHI